MTQGSLATRGTTLPAVLEGRAIRPWQGPAAEDGGHIEELTRGPRRIGVVIVLVFLLAFGGWGATAQLAGGAVAPGRISPESGLKTVQHLEGGIVRELHVRDGDTVEKGAPLVTLENVRQRAEVDALLDRRRARRAEQARIESELLGDDRIAFPADFAANDPADAAVMAAERRLFDKRQELLEARRRVLRQRIGQLSEQITGYQAQVESASEQLDLIEQELADKSSLLAKGLMPKSEVLRLGRMRAEIFGQRGEYTAAIASARQRIGETELELVALDAERSQELADRAREIRTELVGIDQSLAASSDVLTRTVIAAPVDGTVTELKLKTIGGVVLAGEPIMTVVPGADRLIIDARVSPVDIDVVEAGLTAQVRLSAFSAGALPPIHGTVLSVAADTRVDEHTGETYYLARVEVPASELAKAGEEISLVPGMTAEVLIVSGERTMVDYILEPIMRIIRRSLREV